MFSVGPCEPKLHAPLEAHVLEREAGDPPGLPGPFLIEPGERLCLLGRAPLDDLHLSRETVPLNAQQQTLISVELRQTSVGTVLVIRNHFDRPLAYRALIKRHGQKPEPTSVCSVRPGLLGVEHWPDAAEVLAVGDFRLLERDAKPECR
jgi:hypothetical protein